MMQEYVPFEVLLQYRCQRLIMEFHIENVQYGFNDTSHSSVNGSLSSVC